MRVLTITIITICTISVIYGEQEPNKQHDNEQYRIKRWVESILHDISYHDIDEDVQYVDTHPLETLNYLEQYLHNESREIRNIAYERYTAIVNKYPDLKVRQQWTSHLISELADSGIKEPGLTNGYGEVMASYLHGFCASDFSESGKKKLLEVLALASEHPEWGSGVASDVILACGVAGMEEAKPYLAKIIEMDKQYCPHDPLDGSCWTLSLTWSAMLASARIYQSEDIQRCIDTVKFKSYGDHDMLLSNAQELTYIRRLEVVDFFIPYLDKTEMEPQPGNRAMYISLAAMAADKIMSMYSSCHDIDIDAIEKEYEERKGSPLTFEEHIKTLKEWLANPENKKKLRR